MGLAERRLVATAQEQEFKPFAENMKNILGYEVTLTFDWGAVENHSDCQWICSNKKATDYMFNRLEETFKAVCADDMGKTAVREKLKEIKMVPSAGDLEFAGGVFTIRNDLTGNGAWGADQIQAELEKHL